MEHNKFTFAILGTISFITGLITLRSEVKAEAMKQFAPQHLAIKTNVLPENEVKVAECPLHNNTLTVSKTKSITFSEAWRTTPSIKRIDSSVFAFATTLGMGCLADLASLQKDKTHGFAGVLFGAVAGLSFVSAVRKEQLYCKSQSLIL